MTNDDREYSDGAPRPADPSHAEQPADPGLAAEAGTPTEASTPAEQPGTEPAPAHLDPSPGQPEPGGDTATTRWDRPATYGYPQPGYSQPYGQGDYGQSEPGQSQPGQSYYAAGQPDEGHYSQGQYTQPQYGQGEYGQSHYGQSPYGQGQYGQGHYGQQGRYAAPGYGATPPASPSADPAKPSRAPGARRTVLVAAVLAALVGGGVGAGTVALAGDNGTPSASAGLLYSTQQAPAAKVDGTVSAAAAKIGPSVVTINVRSQQESDTGSGVIIRADGYVLTNNHVISTAANGSGQIQVVFKDGSTASATIVGADSSDDLAVIKVAKTGLTAAAFASSSDLEVGQSVVAVGAPLGLSDTVTSGIVSNLTRPVTTSDNNNQATFNAIQTDAAINPGNSGGPLVNLNGDVVGINAAIASDQSQGGLQVPGSQPGNIGIGFAIPSDEASRIANQLIETGHATHAMIGVELSSNSQGTISGAQVQTVQPNTPAASAGLKAGDVITKLGDQLIPDAESLIAAVRSHAPGQQVTVTYVRGGGSPQTVTLTLGTSSN